MSESSENRQELTAHLAELRSRLIRMAFYLVAGGAAAWVFFDPLLDLITYPMRPAMGEIDNPFLFTGFSEPFVVRMQISVVAGLIASAPLLIIELWGFVSPALTKKEKRPLFWIVPLSVLLFASGVALGFWISPTVYLWFVSFVPENAEMRPNVQHSVLFALKFLLSFGLVFELPIVMVGLAKLGIVNARMLLANWRIAIVGSAVLAAVATPSGDAITMLTMAVPILMLYFGSIGLVKIVQRKKKD